MRLEPPICSFVVIMLVVIVILCEQLSTLSLRIKDYIDHVSTCEQLSTLQVVSTRDVI